LLGPIHYRKRFSGTIGREGRYGQKGAKNDENAQFQIGERGSQNSVFRAGEPEMKREIPRAGGVRGRDVKEKEHEVVLEQVLLKEKQGAFGTCIRFRGCSENPPAEDEEKNQSDRVRCRIAAGRGRAKKGQEGGRSSCF